MVTPKRISRDGIERALEKAERYRLLNEPGDAESSCLDILEVGPENQRSLVALLLARTDQFPSPRGTGVAAAREVLPRLTSDYQRAYYAGIICERWVKLARSCSRGPRRASTGFPRRMAHSLPTIASTCWGHEFSPPICGSEGEPGPDPAPSLSRSVVAWRGTPVTTSRMWWTALVCPWSTGRASTSRWRVSTSRSGSPRTDSSALTRTPS